MRDRSPSPPPSRRGTIAVLAAFLILPLLAMVAFAVDYGYLLKIRTDLQRAADAAALAAVQELVPAADGTQDLDKVRSKIREYLRLNMDPTFIILDSDIEIGQYDRTTIYSQVTLLDSGIFDTVRVTVRRDAQANLPVSLFFARVLGSESSGVTASATAVLQRGSAIPPGAMILPFAIWRDDWNNNNFGDTWSIYGDKKLIDSSKLPVAGNWGTVDIGPANNSTVALCDQITKGLIQNDLNALYADGRIPDSSQIEAKTPLSANGDTGLSSGLNNAVAKAKGLKRIIPLFDTLTGSLAGGNLEFHIVGWGVVEVEESRLHGNKKSYVDVKKAYAYFGELGPQKDLSAPPTDVIGGAITSPALVE
ncbi:MAG: pilus assembly protein TadG-related protein [Planctomycetia bacterium]|nr:pilus assembly protein TadG-related protein [Planctomycetia bacterium]